MSRHKQRDMKPGNMNTDRLHLLFYFLWNAFKNFALERKGVTYVEKDAFHCEGITEVTEDTLLGFRTLEGPVKSQRVPAGSYIAVIRPGSHKAQDYKGLVDRGQFAEPDLLERWFGLNDPAPLKTEPKKRPRKTSTPKKRRG